MEQSKIIDTLETYQVRAISQPGQEIDQNGRKPSRINNHGLAHKLSCGTHLKQGVQEVK
jgi:hypothetical protein